MYLLCSGAALYEISLQRELAMRDAEAIAQLQLLQKEQLLERQHHHAAESSEVWSYCQHEDVSRMSSLPKALPRPVLGEA